MAAGHQQGAAYCKPSIVDYGSLIELTTANGMSEAEDGLGKILHTDGSSGSIVP
jgi:hypothetical protein